MSDALGVDATDVADVGRAEWRIGRDAVKRVELVGSFGALAQGARERATEQDAGPESVGERVARLVPAELHVPRGDDDADESGRVKGVGAAWVQKDRTHPQTVERRAICVKSGLGRAGFVRGQRVD